MLPIERKETITDIIREKKSITVNELRELFDVSEETIRRDLAQLEKEGILNRVYGGAYVVDGVQNDVDINLRENIYLDSKVRIAKLCSRYIKNGDSIILDSSTTALYIAREIMEMKITVITNSMKIANLLSEKENIKMILIGGSFNSKTMSFYGRNAETFAEKYFADKVFVSCRALSINHGLMDSNEYLAEMRKTFLGQGNEIFLVADFSKFDRIAFVHIADFDDINYIVTDKELSNEWKKLEEEKGIQIIDRDSGEEATND